MKRKFVLAAALAGACFFVAGCEDDADMTSLNTGMSAAETRACDKSDCCKKDGDVAAAETKAGCCSSKATCSEKGEVAAAETKAKTGCCKKEAQPN